MLIYPKCHAMSYSQTDLNNINTAIATGELSVESNGRKVVFRSMDDLMKAKKVIEAELASAASSSNGVRRGSFRVTFATHRGD